MNDWQLMAGAIVLILGAIFKFVLDYRKQQFDRDQAIERLKVLEDIAVSNRLIRDGQLKQNGKLSEVVSVNEAHHQELIRAITASCKAKPIFPQEENKT